MSATKIVTFTPHRAAGRILTPRAIDFLVALHDRFEPERRDLLDAREERQVAFDSGERPNFLAETADVRGTDWSVVQAPAALADRRVEITGPVDRKMVINALNSGANVFLADFEDASSPTWNNVLVRSGEPVRRGAGDDRGRHR